jgi:hypothetical protein
MMLSLSPDERLDAVAKLAQGIRHAQRRLNLKTDMAVAQIALEALGEDFDVAALDPGPVAVMHRHPAGFVDHMNADHGHGACSEHPHWAMGAHEPGVAFEESTAENDPLGHITEAEEFGRVLRGVW